MTEFWAAVPGFPAYEVSDNGNVRSLPQKHRGVRPGKTLKQETMTAGHKRVHVRDTSGVDRRVLVHRLVLLTFVGPPAPDQQGCHNNGNPADNRPSNLRWDTSSSNQLDKVRHGTHNESRKTHCPYGHEYDETNTYRNNGRRACRACRTVAEQIRRRTRVEGGGEYV